jgi:hypothetical protein
MRKLIVLAISLIALAVPTAAMAAVSYDDYRVGSVDKGDIQSLFGWNDAALQSAAKNGQITFTNKLVTVKDSSWTCSDGSTQHHFFTTTSVRPLDVAVQKNPNGKVLGWTLNGLSKTDFGTTTGVGSDGQRFPSYACPAGAFFTGLNVAQSHSTIAQVNGIDLPNTPVLPAV